MCTCLQGEFAAWLIVTTLILEYILVSAAATLWKLSQREQQAAANNQGQNTRQQAAGTAIETRAALAALQVTNSALPRALRSAFHQLYLAAGVALLPAGWCCCVARLLSM
jgi:hypothetical protein